MRPFLASSTLCLALGIGFWFALNSTLTDMTQRDCTAGVQRACDQLQRGGRTVTYALMRGAGRHAQFVTAPEGLGAPGQILPPVLAADTDAKHAWLSPDLNTAIESQSLLRMAFGLTTEVRAIR